SAVINGRVPPSAVAFLAGRIQPIAVLTDIPASLLVAALRTAVSVAVIAISPTAAAILAIAAQATVIVDDFATPSAIINGSITPVAACGLAGRFQAIAVVADVPAGLLVAARRDAASVSPLRRSAQIIAGQHLRGRGAAGLRDRGSTHHGAKQQQAPCD